MHEKQEGEIGAPDPLDVDNKRVADNLNNIQNQKTTQYGSIPNGTAAIEGNNHKVNFGTSLSKCILREEPCTFFPRNLSCGTKRREIRDSKPIHKLAALSRSLAFISQQFWKVWRKLEFVYILQRVR